ncbi:Insulin-like growth factor binding protein 3 [Scophthalmus maximus]|uniref:Insulin-like growth factor binding protein 3 n=1 Tax=Scophthalmus maximus TaxID=52904 RepID=A0A2U9C1K1_SCOMX|nr:Insulin-like growth factor binding protein 3 [Scophthalmus maximus]
MPGLCVLCVAAALAALARLVGAAGPVVRCEPCDAAALLLCKPLPKECAERMREPGCGCCTTCETLYQQVCASPNRVQSTAENGGNQVEEGCANATQTATVPPGEATVKGGHSRGSMDTRPPLHNKLIQKDQNRKKQSYKVESVSGGANMDMHNFSLESKRETEYGPCRREMESILNSLKISNVLNPRGFRIPNCDRKGFYKKKQCRPSKGRRRGYCWCVDKYGQPLPGLDGRERGETQCYNLESK